MTTDLETGIEYYKDLLLYQYINAPNARATVGLLVTQALVDLLPVAVDEAFDIETAVGPQLDILGEYIGFDRYVVGVIDRDYFTLDDYITSPSPFYGLTTYTDVTVNADVSMYAYVLYNEANNALEDSEYRFLLKLKIVLNASLNGLHEINDLLFSFFALNLIMIDQRDMSLSYFVLPASARIVLIAADENLLPKPMGVEITGIFQMDDISLLWGLTDYIEDSGFDVGLSTYAGWTDADVLEYEYRIN